MTGSQLRYGPRLAWNLAGHRCRSICLCFPRAWVKGMYRAEISSKHSFTLVESPEGQGPQLASSVLLRSLKDKGTLGQLAPGLDCVSCCVAADRADKIVVIMVKDLLLLSVLRVLSLTQTDSLLSEKLWTYSLTFRPFQGGPLSSPC